MADAVDLKSIVRKDVRVRLPPSAPNANIKLLYLHDLLFGTYQPVTTKAQSLPLKVLRFFHIRYPKALAFANDTEPGPAVLDDVVVRLLPSGWASSVAAPLSSAFDGNVMSD